MVFIEVNVLHTRRVTTWIQGHIRQLLKQAEFVGHLERLTSHRIFRGNWLHPRLGSLLSPKRGIPTKITFDCHERYIRESSLKVPARLREALFLLASGNLDDYERCENCRATRDESLIALWSSATTFTL